MRELLIVATEYAVMIIDAMALVVIVYAAVQAFLGSVRLALVPSDSQQAREVWLRLARGSRTAFDQGMVGAV